MNRTGETQTADGRYVIHPDGRGGFSVAYGPASPHTGCNAMPGATGGFRSTDEALLAIRCLDHVGGEKNSARWWDLWHRVSGVTQRERALQHRMAENLGFEVRHVSRHESRWVQPERERG